MKVKIFGVPLDIGSEYDGANLGPEAMRIAGLVEAIQELGHTVEDEGDLPVTSRKKLPLENSKAKYLHEVQRVGSVLCDKVEQALADGYFPLILGGDHAVAIGSIAGISRYFCKRGKKLGVIWIDAHADINTPETTPSGNIHGMPLAVCVGLGAPELTEVGGKFQKVKPKYVHLIGIRSVDKGEKALLRKLGIQFYTMTDIDKFGMQRIISRAVQRLLLDVDAIHISLDLDGLDPEIAPGVATPVKGGLDYREAHLIMETVAECGKLCSLEVTECNPILDVRNRTAQTAAELILSALGKRII